METKTLTTAGTRQVPNKRPTPTHDTGKENTFDVIPTCRQHACIEGSSNLTITGNHNSIQVGRDNGSGLDTINDLIKQLAGCNIVVNIYYQGIGHIEHEQKGGAR